MSASRVFFGLVVGSIFASAMGCAVSVKTKTRYVEGNVTRDDANAWTGQPISIRIEGVGLSVNGGLKVTSDPSITNVRATARMLAMALPAEKLNADQSIVDAKATFTITSSATGITIACGHGGTHGSSNGGESGCELAEIAIPAGTSMRPLTLEILSGNGTTMLSLGNASIKNLGVNNNSSSDIVASLPATQGGTISIVSSKAGDITATLPSGFSADQIVIGADAASIVNNVSGAVLGVGAGGVGTDGAGLVALSLTSTPFAGSSGTVTLQ